MGWIPSFSSSTVSGEAGSQRLCSLIYFYIPFYILFYIPFSFSDESKPIPSRNLGNVGIHV